MLDAWELITGPLPPSCSCACRQMFANQKLVSTAAAKEVAEAKQLADAQRELGRAQAQVCDL